MDGFVQLTLQQLQLASALCGAMNGAEEEDVANLEHAWMALFSSHCSSYSWPQRCVVP